MENNNGIYPIDPEITEIVQIEPNIYPEDKLNERERFELSTIIEFVSKEGLKLSFIDVFNEKPELLPDTGLCFLLNYLIAGKLPRFAEDNYKLYSDENNKQLILSEKEANDKSKFKLLEERKSFQPMTK